MTKKTEFKEMECPTHLKLSLRCISDMDRVVALQIAEAMRQEYGLPDKCKYVGPLALSFCNGIAYIRCWDGLNEEQRKEVIEYYEPLKQLLFADEKKKSN